MKAREMKARNTVTRGIRKQKQTSPHRALGLMTKTRRTPVPAGIIALKKLKYMAEQLEEVHGERCKCPPHYLNQNISLLQGAHLEK